MRKNSRLPNFHNLGILLRILLIVTVFCVLAAVLLSNALNDFLPLLAQLSSIVQPILLVSILLLYLLYPWLNKLKYWFGLAFIMVLEVLIATIFAVLYEQYFTFEAVEVPYRIIILTAITTGIVMYYFNLQQRAYSPAIAEARLQALQARIRPHFLFNSINAALSLIRSQPKKAETALEDMSDLFRVLMAENRELVPLSNEIDLCRQYLNIESLRMEDRLSIDWDLDDITEEESRTALIPPLILQPLIENAVYHGVEPIPEGGLISVSIGVARNDLTIRISNPYLAKNDDHQGNKMALKNIKERLALHFDLEASVSHQSNNQQYTVNLRMPFVTTHHG